MAKKGTGLRFDAFEHDDQIIVGIEPSIAFSGSFDISGQEPSSALLLMSGEYNNPQGGDLVIRVFIDGQIVRPAVGLRSISDGFLSGASGKQGGIFALTVASNLLAIGTHAFLVEAFLIEGTADSRIGKRTLAILRT